MSLTVGVPGAPGTYLVDIEDPAALTPPVDTGQALVAAITEKGPLGPTRIRSAREFTDVFGSAHYATVGRDEARAFFASGGQAMLVSRVVGGDAVKASATLGEDLLEVEASGPGEYADDWHVKHVRDGDQSRVKLYDGDPDNGGNLVEVIVGESVEDLLTANSFYFSVDRGSGWDDESSLDDVPEETAQLSGGDDDRDTIDSDDWEDALNRFNDRYGPGQLLTPNRNPGEVSTAIIDHLNKRERVERVAFLDTDRDDDVTAVVSEGGNIADRRVALFRPVKMTVRGVTRTIPGSLAAAGLVARVDRDNPTAHVAAAGNEGLLPDGSDIIDEYSTSDRENLADAGVNPWDDRRGAKLYGFRATNGDPLHIARHRMRLAADLNRELSEYEFGPTDSDTVSEARGEVLSVLADHEDAGGIDDDYEANVTGNVDTLVAEVDYSPTGFAERVIIAIPVPQAS